MQYILYCLRWQVFIAPKHSFMFSKKKKVWIYGIFVPNIPSAFKLKFNWSQGSKDRTQPFHIRAVGDECKREEKRNLIYMSMMKIRRYWFTDCLYYKISIRIQTGHSPSVSLTEVPLFRKKDLSFTDYGLACKDSGGIKRKGQFHSLFWKVMKPHRENSGLFWDCSKSCSILKDKTMFKIFSSLCYGDEGVRGPRPCLLSICNWINDCRSRK